MQTLRLSNRMGFSPSVHWATVSLMIAILVLSLLASPLAPVSHAPTNIPSIASAFSQLSLAFVPKQEQTGAAVQFEVYDAGNKLTFIPHGTMLDLPGDSQPLQMSFLNASESTTITAGTPLPGIVNDFRGNQPTSWQTNIPTYASIHYQELYPGVNLRYEGNDGLLESTFDIAAGADPALIRWQYTGAAAVAVDEVTGDLLVTLPDQSQVVERAPIAWQEIGGKRVPVTVAFSLAFDNSISFAVGKYNPALPLIIDPSIVYETIQGLGDFSDGLDIAVDAAGNAYVLGRVYDSNNDVGIVKLAPNGSVLYTTYLRGNKGDFGSGISLDAAGDIYVAGGTDSLDFPILNAIKPVKDGVTREGFITKLANGDGSLLFSTFFGGSRSDEIYDITLNDAGEIYVVGKTQSTNFPTVNPIQSGLNLNQCFCDDAFVTKFSPDAMTVLYSTYLGGAARDSGQSIALDADDNIYITGSTQSDDFPTQAAIQPNRAGVNQDVDLFVSKISADGSSLDYSTYLGGTRNESARRIAVDSTGNAFVAGTTISTDFPTTAGAYRDQYIGEPRACLSGLSLPIDCTDMFVTKFVPDGSSLAYSTYLGGDKDDNAKGIAINEAGEAYVIGESYSTVFPGVPPRTELGYYIVLAKLNAGGSDLLYAVGIDSQVANAGHGIALDNAGDVYITGAQNVPEELYVAKITEGGGGGGSNQLPVAVASADPQNGNAPLAVQFSSDGSSDPDGAINAYAWDFGDGNTSSEANPSHTYTAPGTYDAVLVVTDNNGATGNASVTINVAQVSQNELHVQSQSVTRQQYARRYYRGVDTLLITDQNNQPVAGAAVTVTYFGPNSGQASGVTGADGTVTLTTSWKRNPNGNWCFEVTNVAKDGYTYNPNANVVTLQCE